MAKSLFEKLGGKYERKGDYLIPCLTVPAEEEQPIDIWGQRHLDYLKQYRKVTYTNLLTSGRLNAYLADIDRQAQERFERLIEGMKQALFIFISLIQFVQAAILYTVRNRRSKMFEYMTAQEAAEKWNVSLRWVQRLCKENRIEGAMNINRVWLIPITAEKPIDRRKKKS